MNTRTALLIFGAIVLIFDTVISFAFRGNPENYRKMAPFSLIFYALAGVFAA